MYKLLIESLCLIIFFPALLISANMLKCWSWWLLKASYRGGTHPRRPKLNPSAALFRRPRNTGLCTSCLATSACWFQCRHLSVSPEGLKPGRSLGCPRRLSAFPCCTPLALLIRTSARQRGLWTWANLQILTGTRQKLRVRFQKFW